MTQFEKSSERVYNPNMQANAKNEVDQAMPAVIGYLVILAVAILGFQFFDTGYQKVLGIALLVGFTILYARMPDRDTVTWKLHLHMGVMTAIVVVLLIIEPTGGVFSMLFFILSPLAMMIFPQRIGMLWIGIFTVSPRWPLGYPPEIYGCRQLEIKARNISLDRQPSTGADDGN
ncbi:hypothetical protein ACFLXI_09420 [Chloroflexota bacterium]